MVPTDFLAVLFANFLKPGYQTILPFYCYIPLTYHFHPFSFFGFYLPFYLHFILLLFIFIYCYLLFSRYIFIYNVSLSFFWLPVKHFTHSRGRFCLKFLMFKL